MKRKILAGGMILVMLGAILTGCGGDDADDTTAADEAAAEQAAAEEEAAAAAAEEAAAAAAAEEAAAAAAAEEEAAAAAEEEAAAAAAEEEAAAEEAAAEEPAATGGAPTTFDYLTYTDDTYGFTIAYDASWTDGIDYGEYERFGGGDWAVPGLSFYPDGYENDENGEIVEPITDHRETVVTDAEFGEMVSENAGVLANGTEVMIYIYETASDFPGTDAVMYVDINGTGVLFRVTRQLPAHPWQGDDYSASCIELLLSLDF